MQELKALLGELQIAMPYICCCTAYAEASFKRRAIEAGMDNFLTKPMSYKDLTTVLSIIEE